MNPLEMMMRSGVMNEWRPASRRQERAYMRKTMSGLLPEDKTWHVALLAAAVVIGAAVLFVQWWLCV